MSKYLYWYYRHYGLYVSEYATLKDAVEALVTDAEGGTAAYVGIEHDGRMLDHDEWSHIERAIEQKARDSWGQWDEIAKKDAIDKPFELHIKVPDSNRMRSNHSAYISRFATREDALAEARALGITDESRIVVREGTG